MGNVTDVEKVVRLSQETDADVLLLAECKLPIDELVRGLNYRAKRLYFPDLLPEKRITTLTRFLPQKENLVGDSGELTLRHYHFPLGDSLLIAGVHLRSKLRQDSQDQFYSTIRLIRDIMEAENRIGHSRTVVIGDFNMNPYEPAMVSSEGMHAVADRRIAQRVSRTVNQELKSFFYNPMWNTLGDDNRRPPGTFYFDTGTYLNYYWNAFDQVLIRPSILRRLPRSGVSIVTTLGDKSILTASGRPSTAQGSDHLPISVQLSALEEN